MPYSTRIFNLDESSELEVSFSPKIDTDEACIDIKVTNDFTTTAYYALYNMEEVDALLYKLIDCKDKLEKALANAPTIINTTKNGKA